ncbi:hypothetical protein D3C86_1095580 [compost metagenome]
MTAFIVQIFAREKGITDSIKFFSFRKIDRRVVSIFDSSIASLAYRYILVPDIRALGTKYLQVVEAGLEGIVDLGANSLADSIAPASELKIMGFCLLILK